MRRSASPAGAQTAPPASAASVEAGLLQPSTRLLREFPLERMTKDYRAHLVRRLYRNPRELRAHVERLLLARAAGDREGVHAALADLFDVLDSSGQALRARLLRAAAPYLTRVQKHAFLERLMHGERHCNEPRGFLGSATSKPVVIERENGCVVLRDLRTMATDALRAGDPSAAMALLECAIDRDPGDRDANRALLEILEDPGMREPLLRARTHFLGRHVAMPERWRDAAADGTAH